MCDKILNIIRLARRTRRMCQSVLLEVFMNNTQWQEQIERAISLLEEAKGDRLDFKNRIWLTENNQHHVTNVCQNKEDRLKNVWQIVCAFLETDPFIRPIIVIQNGREINREEFLFNKEALLLHKNLYGQWYISIYNPTKGET